MTIKKVCVVCENEFWTRGNRAKYCSPECKRSTKKEITEVLMLSPLFHKLNPQEKETVIAELTERINGLEDQLPPKGLLFSCPVALK